MNILGRSLFPGQINWEERASSRWTYAEKVITVGFGPETVDQQAQHAVQGFEFACQFRGVEIDELEEFIASVSGNAGNFWLKGPSQRFRVSSSPSSTSLVFVERGEVGSWTLRPGSLLLLCSAGGHRQAVKISAVVDNGDGTETVTFGQVEVLHESSSTSAHQSDSSVASFTSSSSSVSSQSSGNSSSSAKSSSSSEQLTSASSAHHSSSSSEGFWAIDSTWTAYTLHLVRMSEDGMRVTHRAERFQERTFKLVEVPLENTAPESQNVTTPIWLYEFRMVTESGTTRWRYTSFPTNVTTEGISQQSSSSSAYSRTSSSSQSGLSQSSSSSSSQISTNSSSSSSQISTNSSSSSVSSSSSSSLSMSSSSSSSSVSSSSSDDQQTILWTAAAISHGKITTSISDAGGTAITCDVDTVEPISLVVPNRTAGKLLVSIYATTTLLEEPRLIFTGEVDRVRMEGRIADTSVKQHSESLQSRFPSFFIQRTCNYRLYDGNTCRVSKSAFQKSTTITSALKRNIVVSSASVAGISEGWFRNGSLIVGTGIGARVYFIVSSNASVGDTMELQLSDPWTGTTPVACTLLAGCDGHRSTCVSKFDNLKNFGGHNPALTNMSLVAIRANSAKGGKK